jgi:dethiobiotin synthetase
MKPIAAGATIHRGRWQNEDVVALRAASSLRVPPELDNPFLLPHPVSPHLAAQRAGIQIDIAEILRRYRQLAKQSDFVVVEGAGGFQVPLTSTETGADLAEALGLPVILVVGLRLGCLSHTLLTAESIRARGLAIAGWIANRIDPEMGLQDENVAYLKARLHAPLLADIAHARRPDARSIRIELPPAWRTAQ